MAEEKKDAPSGVKKEAPKAPSGPVVWEEVLLLILGIVALLFVFIPRFFATDHIQSSDGSTTKTFNVKNFYNRVFFDQTQTIRDDKGAVIDVVKTPSLIDEGKSRFDDFLKTSSILVFSLLLFLILLFWGIIYYNKFRTQLIVENYKKKFFPEDETLEDKNEKVLEASEPDNNGIINPRWQLIGKYYNSANQADWKLAILEADIMLYEVLNKSGFQGFSIGEMLKFTDKSKLATLDLAWRAHKIRNEIAHQGLDYVLTRSKVEEAIGDYEQVFEELNFI
ncbi:hypothetical protein H7X65_01705 [Candidatus Parcubacteria bacterium]|nr:hypothetical protein [Candidatus Parcubacteria bacterium]